MKSTDLLGPSNTYLVVVTEVLDGDTVHIVLQDTGHIMKLRPIGIDAPETEKQKSFDEYAFLNESDKAKAVKTATGYTIPGEPYGEEAKKILYDLVYQKMVRISFDVQPYDKYGRTLVYMHLINDDGTELFINDYLVRIGAGQELTIEPNLSYRVQFRKSQQIAKKEFAGMWNLDYWRASAGLYAKKSIGQNNQESVPPHFLRIGDTSFLVPPESIVVTKKTIGESTPMIRSDSSFHKNTGQYEYIIDIAITFPNLTSINTELRPLLAQLKKCPFLPIENLYLNETLLIQAVTVRGLTVSTIPDFPTSLSCQMQFYAFDHESYIGYSNGEVKPFREYFNWELFRWYYQRNLNAAKIIIDPVTKMPLSTGQIFYEKIEDRLDNMFVIRTPFEKDLEKIRSWRKIRNKVVFGWTADKANKPFFSLEDYQLLYDELRDKRYEFTSERQIQGFESLKEYESFFDSEDEETFLKNLDLVIAMELKEYDITMEDWFVQTASSVDEITQEIKPKITIANMNVSLNNIISSQNLRSNRYPVHQYLGSQDTICEVTLLVEGDEMLQKIDAAFEQANRLALEYSSEISCSFIEFDHPLFRLFSVKGFVIDTFSTSTIDGVPGVYEVHLTMIAYNRLSHKKLEIQHINTQAFRPNLYAQFADDNASGLYAAASVGIGLLGLLIPFIGPALAIASPFLLGFNLYNWYKSSPLSNGRYGMFMSNKQLDSLDVRQNALYEKQVEDHLDHVNLYPDLELPTYAEVKEAGFQLQIETEGFYVEPDFYFIYDDISPMRHLYSMIDDFGLKARLSDQLGDQIFYDEKGEKTYSESLQDRSYRLNQIKDFSGFQFNLNDATGLEETLTPDQIESIVRVRVKALNEQHQLENNQAFHYDLILSFIRAFDPKMRQYYFVGSNQDLTSIHSYGTNSALFVPYGERVSVMMDSQLRYHTNQKLLNDMSYIGVMRISPKISNYSAEILSKNTQLNVEEGVLRMFEYWMQSAFATKDVNAATIEKYFTNFYVNDIRIRSIFVLMQYLGLNQEWQNLNKSYQTVPNYVIKLIQNILIQTKAHSAVNPIGMSSVSKNWDQIYETLPKRDLFSEAEGYYAKLGKQLDVNEEEIQQISNSGKEKIDQMIAIEEKYRTDRQFMTKSMFTDLIKYDMRGRLARAFPTYALIFIDEGRYMNAVKMSDQYFFYKGVSSISYVNSRKMASSTLTLELNNLTGSLTDSMKAQDLKNRSLSELLHAFMHPKDAAAEAESFTRNRNPKWYKSIFLRTGARVHFRMGFGGSFKNLPIIMNGTITSIENDQDRLLVIAQDDGIELVNKLKVDINGTTEGVFDVNLEPTEIVDAILRDDRYMVKDSTFSKALSNEDFVYHSYGLMHFGNPGSPSGPWFNANRTMAENNINVYQTTGEGVTKTSGFWNMVLNQFGAGSENKDEFNFCLFLYDKTVWDILNICAAVADDYVVAVHPFMFRSTIFSGSPLFPIKHGYEVIDRSPELIEQDKTFFKDSFDLEWEPTFINTHDVTYRFKTFRQLHLFDSTDFILENNIKATEENLYTIVIPTYMNEGKMENTDPIYVDTDIFAEKQKTTYVDTAMDSRGVPLLNYVPIIGGWLNKPFRYLYDEKIAIKIGASALKEYMKDMYDGHLLVTGYPAIKPYDQVYIDDRYTRMNGFFEVKEVYHQFNFESGFVSLIKPDLICITNDSDQLDAITTASSLVVSATVTKMIQKKMQSLGHLSTAPILEFFKMAGKLPFEILRDNPINDKIWDKLKKSDSMSKIIDQYGASGTKDIDNLKKLFENWKQNGGIYQILDWLDDISYEDHLNNLDSMKKGLFNKMGWSYNESTKISLMRRINAGVLTGAGKLASFSLRGIFKAIGLMFGPLGSLLEFFIIEVVFSSLAEMVNRWLFTRQALMMLPLKQDMFNLKAGINGHRGSVKGDRRDTVQALLFDNKTRWLSYIFFDFLLGVDTALYDQTNQEENAEAFIFEVSEANKNDYGFQLFLQYFMNVKDQAMRSGKTSFTDEEKEQLILDAFTSQPEVNQDFVNHYEERVTQAQQSYVNRYVDQQGQVIKDSLTMQEYEEKRDKAIANSNGLSFDFSQMQNPTLNSNQNFKGYLLDDIKQIFDLDLRKPSGLPVQAYDEYFKGTVYQGIGQYFVDMEQNGIDIYYDSLIPFHDGKTDNFEIDTIAGGQQSFWNFLIDRMYDNYDAFGIEKKNRTDPDYKDYLPTRGSKTPVRLYINAWFLAALMQSEFSKENFHNLHKQSCIKNRFNFFGLYAFDGSACRYAMDYREKFLVDDFVQKFGVNGYGQDANGNKVTKAFYEVPGSIGQSKGMREQLHLTAFYILVRHITPGAKYFTSTSTLNGFINYATHKEKRELIAKVMGDIAVIKTSVDFKDMKTNTELDAVSTKAKYKITDFNYDELKKQNSRLVRIPFDAMNPSVVPYGDRKNDRMILRPETVVRIKEMATTLQLNGYKESIEILEAYSTKNEKSWHHTGFAFDVYVKNGQQIGNDVVYSSPDDVLVILRAGLKVGLNGVICGSKQIVLQLQKEFPEKLIVHNPRYITKVQFSHHFSFQNKASKDNLLSQED